VPSADPYRSILVRAVEVVYAVDEALRLIDRYEPPAPCHVDVPPRAATGHGAGEAPRGVLFHRYAVDAEGIITSARIVPSTSQNQASIEDDLRQFVAGRLDLDDEHLNPAVRAGDSQLRPVHLLRDPFPGPHREPRSIEFVRQPAIVRNVHQRVAAGHQEVPVGRGAVLPSGFRRKHG
jgi:hypothetical protein